MPPAALWSLGLGELLIIAALLVVFVLPTVVVLAPVLWAIVTGKPRR